MPGVTVLDCANVCANFKRSSCTFRPVRVCILHNSPPRSPLKQPKCLPGLVSGLRHRQAGCLPRRLNDPRHLLRQRGGEPGESSNARSQQGHQLKPCDWWPCSVQPRDALATMIARWISTSTSSSQSCGVMEAMSSSESACPQKTRRGSGRWAVMSRRGLLVDVSKIALSRR
jgi:hypothetical protein